MKKVIIYGSHFCPDCVELKEALSQTNIEFEYYDISLDFAALKRFLKIRDTNPLYDPIRGTGKIGIPTIVIDDEVMLELDDAKLEELMKK